jgi:hypothetical protein
MRKFARAGNKVIFVNSISMGLPSLGHKDLLPRIKRKLGSYSKLAATMKASPSSRRRVCLSSALRRALDQSTADRNADQTSARSRGLTKPILWIAIPLPPT